MHYFTDVLGLITQKLVLQYLQQKTFKKTFLTSTVKTL